RIQLSGSGPDDAICVAEPRLQIARRRSPAHDKSSRRELLTILARRPLARPPITGTHATAALWGHALAHGVPSKQVHSAAIKGRPSARPACFWQQAASSPSYSA